MRDQNARVEIAELRAEVHELKRRVVALESNKAADNGIYELDRQFRTLVKELGFSFNDGVFESDVKDPNSSLFRIQLQIAALVRKLGLEESYPGGKLAYRESGSK